MPKPENVKDSEFKPGQSGNPKGYPKGVPHRSTIARKVLEMKMEPPEKILKNLHELYPALGKRFTVEDIITMVQALKALIDKDTQAYKAIMDSAYGFPVQDITSEGEKININIIVDSDDSNV